MPSGSRYEINDGAAWPAVAALSALSDAECREHADRLRRIGVLGPPGGVARFSHPSLRLTTAEAGLTPVELAAEHARAAEVLHADGAAAEQVAEHLLLAEPADGDWRVDVLRQPVGGRPDTRGAAVGRRPRRAGAARSARPIDHRIPGDVAAVGRTDRQIAQSLLLSPETVVAIGR